MKNTLEKGAVRTIIYKEGKDWIGAALEFNIVEVGEDPREVLFALEEAMRGYLLSARKSKLRPQVLNQSADSEYEAVWNYAEGKKMKRIVSPIEIFSHGYRALSFA